MRSYGEFREVALRFASNDNCQFLQDRALGECKNFQS
jgi:hypothetical protein